MVIIFIAMGAPVTIYLAQLPFYWLLMLMMGVAWGLFSGQVTAVSKDFYQLVRSSFTALMWLSGIFYQISNIKSATLRFILRLNPIWLPILLHRPCMVLGGTNVTAAIYAGLPAFRVFGRQDLQPHGKNHHGCFVEVRYD